MTDGELLRKYIVLHGGNDQGPNIRRMDGEKVHLWIVVPECLEMNKEEAIQALQPEEEQFDFTPEEAEAAWIYINRNPNRAKMLYAIFGDHYQELITEPEMEEQTV